MLQREFRKVLAQVFSDQGDVGLVRQIRNMFCEGIRDHAAGMICDHRLNRNGQFFLVTEGMKGNCIQERNNHVIRE